MTIHLHDETGYLGEDVELPAALAAVLVAHGRANADLTLALITDEEVSALNRQFRGVDSVTDVLSFPAEDGPNGDYLGDIVIAFPYVQARAGYDERHTQAWLLLLAVHGALHLLGYTHDEEAAQSQMWEAQAAALAGRGIDAERLNAMLMARTIP